MNRPTDCQLDRLPIRPSISTSVSEEAAALRPLTEELLQAGAWVGFSMFPYRSCAAIAAACAGDWAAAEEHHLTAIHQMDTAPYRVAQPMARERYALMLLDRNARGDHAKARGLLSEALAMYESMEMPFHANRTSARLAAAEEAGPLRQPQAKISRRPRGSGTSRPNSLAVSSQSSIAS
jgi:hypothetical protein